MESRNTTYVTKRDGTKEKVAFDKITTRLERLAKDLPYVDCVKISQKVVAGLYPDVSTTELDNLAAETAAYMSTLHPDYGTLAARVSVSNLHKETEATYSVLIRKMRDYRDPGTQRHAPLVSQELCDFVEKNAEAIQSRLVYSRDYKYKYFGIKTLLRSYLLKMDGRVVERPQHMLMRVSLGIHMPNLEAVFETYDLMSHMYFTHATPTLYNAGTCHPQLSSCFLLDMKADSIDGIYDTLKNCALISKAAGGIGLSVSKIRASDSYIAGTNGRSNGLVPMLRVFNDTARYVDQGGAKRPGAFAVYIEPWHADIFDFIELKKNRGKEEQRARDLFYGLWTPDLFMKRVEVEGTWSLFCPNEAPGLTDCWGDKFEQLYTQYEKEGRARRVVPAKELWDAILESQIETGTPFMLYKDACNQKSNQQNLGCIKSSNLCTEIIEYTAPDEIAVCNLASIGLPKFVQDGQFNHSDLYAVTQRVTRNLDRVIDRNYYPVPEAQNSNLRHRPLGIGVQGLADVFCLLRLPFESPEARTLNKEIFETIYYAALSASCDLSKEYGAYETYPGSPASNGRLQFDLWRGGAAHSGRWDWDDLKRRISEHGLRNSLLVAPMPTASTSQIMGNNECFEPYTSNIYTRRVLSGEFTVINPYLLNDLVSRGLWSEKLKDQIVANNGSVQGINDIPEDIQKLYKTVWEIKQRSLIEMAADRGRYIDQSQSFNVFIAEPTFAKLTTLHFLTWKAGLKTGMYYLRSKPAANAQKVTLASSFSETPSGPVCRREDGCVTCSA